MSTVTNNPLADYQVDHLFTLVGENPLPAYIAANTLLKEHGTVYLVYTARTTTMKEAIVTKLRQRRGITVDTVPLEGYASDAYYIRKGVGDKAKEIAKEHPDARIGLNYTGGTGPMGVHSYQAILNESAQFKEAFFSYLDPRLLKMCIDNLDGATIQRDVPFTMTLEDMIELHGLQPKLKREPTLLHAAKELACLNSDDAGTRAWRQWCKGTLEAKARREDRPDKWQSQTGLAAITLPLRDLPEGLLDAFRVHLGADESGLPLKTVAERLGFKKIEEVCEWLHGTWLESYVLGEVQSLPQVANAAHSITVDKGTFEFDVAFTRGYQLFGVSCTTSSDKKLCKSKLLEAYIRTRQLGGDESRVALVCCYDKPDELKRELALVLPNRKIAVFGREDLPELRDWLKQWVDDKWVDDNSRGEAEA